MSQKRHYAEKAAKAFLRGTKFTCPQDAIDAGYRTEDQFIAFMHGRMKLFWSLNGQKARRKVKARYPVTTDKTRNLPKNLPIQDKKKDADRLALQKRAEDWGQIGGTPQQRIDRQAREAVRLYVDVARHALTGDFPRWLSRHSGMNRETCRQRLLAGIALELNLPPRNQSGLLAEMRERKDKAGAL